MRVCMVYLHICVQVCVHVYLCLYVHCIDGGGTVGGNSHAAPSVAYCAAL